MMVKASSNHKKCDGVKKNVCIRLDRFSGLPEAILCHILSYLPTKEAVRASVLSKRWTDAWASVPCIEIDDRLLFSDPARRDSSEVKNWIMNFVDRVLHRNDVSCLRKLCLRFDEFYNLSWVRDLINAVIMRDVEELDVAFLVEQDNPEFLRERIELPPRLFTSEKLVILKLTDWSNIVFKVPAAVYLPCLKVLYLHLLQFFADDSMKNLLLGCPIIEELDIENAQYENVETLFVQSSSLRSLRVGTQNFCCKEGVIRCVIDATNLEQLDIVDDVSVVYEMVNLPSLVKVKLDICESCPKFVGLQYCCYTPLQILRRLSNIKHLFLSCHLMECFVYADWDDVPRFDVPRFHSLNHLELKTFRYNWSFMSVLLECLPNLKTFVVHKERPRESVQQFQAPKCLMLSLEEIELKGFKGSTDEMEFVRYFLKNAAVLKKMSIQSYFSSPKKHAEISKKLLAFVRGSTECQIIFG